MHPSATVILLSDYNVAQLHSDRYMNLFVVPLNQYSGDTSLLCIPPLLSFYIVIIMSRNCILIAI